MTHPAYAFKWSNYNLERYIKDRRNVAQQKRRDAEILIARAEAIESEAEVLETSMRPCPEEGSSP